MVNDTETLKLKDEAYGWYQQVFSCMGERGVGIISIILMEEIRTHSNHTDLMATLVYNTSDRGITETARELLVCKSYLDALLVVEKHKL